MGFVAIDAMLNFYANFKVDKNGSITYEGNFSMLNTHHGAGSEIEAADAFR